MPVHGYFYAIKTHQVLVLNADMLHRAILMSKTQVLILDDVVTG